MMAAPLQAADTPKASESKQYVPLKQYFALQAKEGPTAAHMKYTPFPNQIVAVPVHSKIHGDITLHFNAHTFKPTWRDRNSDGEITIDEVSLSPTMSTITAAHIGLGSLNDRDDPSIKEAMNVLAKNVEIVTPAALEESKADDHLDKVHGLQLFSVVNMPGGGGKTVKGLSPGEHMKPILIACKAELQP